MDSYILELTKMLLSIDDEDTVVKNFTATCFALSAMRGLSPGQTMVYLVEDMPEWDEWHEEYLPALEVEDSS